MKEQVGFLPETVDPQSNALITWSQLTAAIYNSTHKCSKRCSMTMQLQLQYTKCASASVCSSKPNTALWYQTVKWKVYSCLCRHPSGKTLSQWSPGLSPERDSGLTPAWRTPVSVYSFPAPHAKRMRSGRVQCVEEIQDQARTQSHKYAHIDITKPHTVTRFESIILSIIWE